MPEQIHEITKAGVEEIKNKFQNIETIKGVSVLMRENERSCFDIRV